MCVTKSTNSKKSTYFKSVRSEKRDVSSKYNCSDIKDGKNKDLLRSFVVQHCVKRTESSASGFISDSGHKVQS